MIRTAVLADEKGKWLGTTRVPEGVVLLQHGDELFARTETGVRLSGGGIGVVFSSVEPLVREKLSPI